MILCRCSCGELFKLDDNLGGSIGECQVCGKDLVIPKESDPAVVLVFKAGADNEGMLMPRSEMEQKLADGALEPTDLLWQENSWQPIGNVFGDNPAPSSGADKGKPKLKLRRGGEEGGDKPEEQIVVPAIPQPDQAKEQGVAVPVPVKKVQKGPGALAKLLSRLRRKKMAAKPPTAGPVGGKNWKHSKAFQAVVILLILFIGYKYGFGPLVANFRKQPTNVVVKNGENVNYNVTLGWRREKRELMANSFCRFETWVGMPEWPTLKLTPATGTGPAIKIWVPIRMGSNILVNVGGKTNFRVVDTAGLAGQRLEEGMQQLILDMTNGKAPESSGGIANRIRDLAKGAYKGTVNDKFFDLRGKYRMDNYFGIIDASQMKEQPERPLITVMPSIRVHFGNGSANLTFDKLDNVEGSLKMPGFTVPLPPDIKIVVPKDESLQIFRDEKGTLRLSMNLQGQKLKVQKGTFPGVWEYLAVKAPDKEWDWRWNFKGEGEVNKDKVTVTCAWIKNQNPSVNIEKHVTVKVE